jgi:acyl-CoA thioester hydrolase
VERPPIRYKIHRYEIPRASCGGSWTRFTRMAELRRLHEAKVGEQEIDHLGHMNVRFYLEKAVRASQALADGLGLGPEACLELGGMLELRDAYTRHYREQLVGAAVMGGVLGVEPEGLRLYHELVNTERDERAATFVHRLGLRRRETREPLPLPEMVAESAGRALVPWPEHGRPRTLGLERVPPALTLRMARDRGLAMRRERVVRPEECDAEGFFLAERYQDLVWGGEPSAQRASGVPLFELAEGGKFGWATMENRALLIRLPRAGDRVQSFGAEVELGRKTSFRHHWVFDVEREDLLCTSSIVNLAFDVEARRSIEIPASIRAVFESQYHPDLR